jgi:hypothetical protein
MCIDRKSASDVFQIICTGGGSLVVVFIVAVETLFHVEFVLQFVVSPNVDKFSRVVTFLSVFFFSVSVITPLEKLQNKIHIDKCSFTVYDVTLQSIYHIFMERHDGKKALPDLN